MPSESYKIAFLPSASEDLKEITRYTARLVGSGDAACRLTERILHDIETLEHYPYRRTVYIPIRPLGHEYRTLKVDKYLVFYWIEEDPRVVVVAAVVYGSADISHRMSKLVEPDDFS